MLLDVSVVLFYLPLDGLCSLIDSLLMLGRLHFHHFLTLFVQFTILNNGTLSGCKEAVGVSEFASH